jgi:hypothetical protein
MSDYFQSLGHFPFTVALAGKPLVRVEDLDIQQKPASSSKN